MMHKHEQSPESRWALLAALRFFLAMTVFLGHFFLFVRPDKTGIFGAGYLNPGSAVFGFFILSGYSIAASLERETEGFYRRRIMRIWPLYLVTVMIGILLTCVTPGGFTMPLGYHVQPTTGLSIVASLLMLQTFVGSSIPIVGQIWSLSPEWWHYMIAPWLKKMPSAVLLIWVAISIFAFLHIHPEPGGGIETLSHGAPFLMLSWLWVSGFLYYRLQGTASGFTMLALPSVFILTLGAFTGAPLFITIFALVMSSEIRLPRMLIRSFNFLGDLSFPLYLFHIPAIVIALKLGSNRSAITLLCAVVASVAALYFIDYPARRFFRIASKKTSATVASS